jgi:hypothetical protein
VQQARKRQPYDRQEFPLHDLPCEVQAAPNPDITAVKSKRPTIPIRGPLEKLNVCFGYIPPSDPRPLRHAQRQQVLLQQMEMMLVTIRN